MRHSHVNVANFATRVHRQKIKMDLAGLVEWIQAFKAQIDAIHVKFDRPAGTVSVTSLGPWAGDQQLHDAVTNLRTVRLSRK